MLFTKFDFEKFLYIRINTANYTKSVTVVLKVSNDRFPLTGIEVCLRLKILFQDSSDQTLIISNCILFTLHKINFVPAAHKF